MGIFRRGKKDSSAELGPADTATDLADGTDDSDSGDGAGTDSASPVPPEPAPLAVSRSRGPFDRSEVEGLDGRLDLGALWLTGIPGMELRVEVEEESESLVGVTAVLGESAVQLQAFAAPRTEGIWDEIRNEIAASITSSGGTADKTSGPLGAEIRARMPGQDPDGQPMVSAVRFIGVDGPRWFLRAVLSGRAAVDEDAASALLDVVRSTVVVRGEEAMAPRELLPLKLPVELPPDGQDAASADLTDAELADAGNSDAADADVADEESARAARAATSLDDLKPFERGPEITEIH